MIKFEHNNGDLRCAIFGGTISDLCNDICLEMSLIYGGTCKQNKAAADEFRKNMLMAMIDPELAGKIFSTEIHDEICDCEAYTSGAITVANNEEFQRQLKEILNESE